jgi:hypothetical protein
MQGHFRYLRFKTFSMTSRTPQCEVFWALLLSSEYSGVPEDSKFPTFPSVGLHPPHLAKVGLQHLNRGGRVNLSVVDEEFGCALEGMLACHLGLLE